MGMDAVTRLKFLVSDLAKFYERRFHETALFDPVALGTHFVNDGMMDEREIDARYSAYITKLSEGLDGVLAKHGVRLDPAPPGPDHTAKCETLMTGVRFLGWTINVFDAKTNMPVGIIHWGLYHRHDEFAVPGPAQVAFIKAAPGRTIMI